MIIVDPKKEFNAIKEARKLNIPVFGIVDTNCDPDDVDYVIPANDDAVRSVKVILGVLANAICEARGLEVIDYVSEDEKKKESRESKSEVKETVKIEEPIIEEKIEEEIIEEKIEEEIIEEKIEEVIEDELVEEIIETKKVKKTEKKPVKRMDLTSKTLTELKAIAKDKGLKGYSSLKKEELINLINE